MINNTFGKGKAMIRKRIVHIIITFFLAFSFPMSALADAVSDPAAGGSSTDPTITPAPAPEPQAAPAPAPEPSPGPTSPTGADANTYTYNPDTGLWENQYYTWNPTTHQTQPKTPQDYSYNPATGQWDTTQYVYDAPSGKYVPNVVSSSANPTSALSTPSTNDATANTGPGSTNTINTNSNSSGIFNLFYNAQISNGITLNATSGDAAVMSNTVGGSALTGNALDVSNILNMLKSSFGLQNAADLLTFTQNINGNVIGDIVIDPSQINNSSIAVDNSNRQNNLTINASGSGLINNDITLGANSGDATVAQNTHAGSATTGNADAVANIVNMLNSAITSNKSFLGVININGNLDGDILLPPNFLDQLLASNAPHSTVALNVTQNNTVNNNATINETTNNTINNNVGVNSKSGDATVTENTTAGNASTGNASSSANIANIMDSTFSASDWFGLLFINVLGFWHGSFGVNTDAGNLPQLPSPIVGGVASTSAPTTVFRFVPKKGQSTNAAVLADFAQVVNNPSTSGDAPKAILANSINDGNTPGPAATTAAPRHISSTGKQNAWVIPVASFAVVMLVTGALGSSGEFTDKFYARFLNRRLS
jgi:hypothetical protein